MMVAREIATTNPISIFKAVEKDMGFKLEPATVKLKVRRVRSPQQRPSCARLDRLKPILLRR